MPLSKPRSKQACDFCKLKKAKCNGNRPCGRCTTIRHQCTFSTKKIVRRPVSPGYIVMLEEQQELLIKGLRKLYEWSTTGQTWRMEFIAAQCSDQSSAHEILSSLGILSPEKGCDMPQDVIASADAAQRVEEPKALESFDIDAEYADPTIFLPGDHRGLWPEDCNRKLDISNSEEFSFENIDWDSYFTQQLWGEELEFETDREICP